MKEGTIPVRTGASQSCDYRASRRTVTKGIAWAVPAVLSAVTVPAFAASGCEDVTWTQFCPAGAVVYLQSCIRGADIACLEWDKNYWWAGILDVGKHRSRQ